MKKLFNIFISFLICLLLVCNIFADSPVIDDDSSENITISEEIETKEERIKIYYSDSDINMITNLVTGEVGGLEGTVTITYFDGTVIESDWTTLHKIHAKVIHNMVEDYKFPSSLKRCIELYWSPYYTRTNYRDSEQWLICREDVLEAFDDGIYVPSNVFGATQDPYFSKKYTMYTLYARVDWSTRWLDGTYYYYAYEYANEYVVVKESISAEEKRIVEELKRSIVFCNDDLMSLR